MLILGNCSIILRRFLCVSMFVCMCGMYMWRVCFTFATNKYRNTNKFCFDCRVFFLLLHFIACLCCWCCTGVVFGVCCHSFYKRGLCYYRVGIQQNLLLLLLSGDYIHTYINCAYALHAALTAFKWCV